MKSGKTGIELSREMFRSQKTISTHKRKIMLKLGVKNDLELRKATHKLQPPH
ncbi:LuxR C-terminal-related transcriptional regulator [Enterobacter asburiae]|uniref:LuxR C-terminal-related transcriptional regulator n=1 Tax=Enterobacter asburiae TaxID=61645 RepID=UPI0019D6434C